MNRQVNVDRIKIDRKNGSSDREVSTGYSDFDFDFATRKIRWTRNSSWKESKERFESSFKLSLHEVLGISHYQLVLIQTQLSFG